jgi:hypothetical protein
MTVANPSMFDSILATAEKTVLDPLFGAAFFYRRNADLIPWNAVKLFHETGLDEDHGIVETWIGYGFEGSAADLILNAEQIIPQRGDEICEELTDGWQIYRVLDLADGRCYALSDTDGGKLIVFAKAIRQEASL